MAGSLSDNGGAGGNGSAFRAHDEGDTNAPDALEETTAVQEGELGGTFEAVRQALLRAPERDDEWDRLEQIARQTDRMRDAAETYRHVLSQSLERGRLLQLADRAVRFHDEWHNEPDDVFGILMQVLEIEPTARWAFDRVSLQLMQAAQWDDLLELYDTSIEETGDRDERLRLLDEAAAVAKDCAGKPERAVDYLSRIFKLCPSNERTAAALERLLKSQKRHRELIDFWTTRLEVLGGSEALATRRQIARCWLEHLNDPRGALEAAEPLLADPLASDDGCKLLELILGSPASDREVRRKARELLSAGHDGKDRWNDVVRGLRAALPHVEADEQVELHEEITRRLVVHDQHDDALEHLAALVALAPEDWAPERLDAVLRGEFDEEVASCRPRIDREQGRALMHQAADMAFRRFHNRDRAMDLYRQLLVDVPDDIETIGRLSRLYADAGRTQDLLELRKHELALAEEKDRRLGLRLEIAGLLGAVDDHAAAVETLKANLVERADHEPTISSLLRMLEAQKRYAELADLLTKHASEVEALKRERLAASLWFKAAQLSEHELQDLDRAVECYRRVVDLNPDADALDALADIHLSRHEHAVAVGWLEQRLALTDSGERTNTIARLARAHRSAGQIDQALGTLRMGLEEAPSSLELRRLLCEMHRQAGAWDELVTVLQQGAEQATDQDTRLELLLEAADVYQHGLRKPERAVPVLEQAVALSPSDTAVRIRLAEAFRALGRLNDARTLAKSLIEGFGRRRTPERAKLHLLLAQVVYAQGDVTEAVRQLEQAVSMDMGNVGVQHMLGKVYRTTGQLQRAERAYHALLLLLHRRSALGEQVQDDDIGVAEALYELHRVAKDLGAAERAAENLESAFDTAKQSLHEAKRFERALREAASPHLLLRVLQQRLARTDAPAERTPILIEMASMLEQQLARPRDALDAVLGAVQASPNQAVLHDRARKLAKSIQALDTYVEVLARLAEEALDAGDGPLGSDLLLRLGAIEEQERGQLDRAAELYGRAEDTGERLAEVGFALARVAGARGEQAIEMVTLRRLVDSDLDALPEAARPGVLYRLAELELAMPEALLSGVDTLTQALALEPRHAQAAQALRSALGIEPQNERLLSYFEQLAREASDTALLLDAIERRVALPGATQELLREGVQLAMSRGEDDRLDALLVRAVDIARYEAADVPQALWAIRELASRRLHQGDHHDAIRWLGEAASVASGDEAREIGLQLARIASESLGDLALAADAYEALLEHKPGDSDTWTRLLAVVRQLHDTERHERLLATAAASVDDLQVRNELRIEHASLLRSRPERRDDAIGLLQIVLDDDPDHAEAGSQLAEHLEQSNRMDELAELLARQQDAARARQDVEAGVQFALRIGAISSEPEHEARRVYRATLEWIPDEPRLLRALVAELDSEEDAAERATLLERILTDEHVDDRLDLAVALSQARSATGDLSGVQRALDLAFPLAPSDSRVLVQLQQLAEALEAEGVTLAPNEEAADRFSRAATVYGDRLDDPESAVELAEKALALRPDDPGLLDLLIKYMLLAGQSEAAVDRVSVALDESESNGARRGTLLRTRARILSTSGQFDEAVRDLEAAMQIDGPAVAEDLYKVLVHARESAAERDDFDTERTTTFRLARVLTQLGEHERARNVIARWVQDGADDKEAMQLLLEIDRNAERWEDVIQEAGLLMQVESGVHKAEAALALADACERVGRPGDAREQLEGLFRDEPTHEGVRNRLRSLYEQLQAHRELSGVLLVEASLTEAPDKRFELLRDAGRLRLSSPDQAASAIGPFSEALKIKANNLEVTLLLADAYLAAGLLPEVVQLLQGEIDRQAGRRSREMAALQHRMARAASTGGDRVTEMQWLQEAFESYPQSSDVAAELAELATELGHYELALKALRALATAKLPGPMSRQMALLKQAQIAKLQGDDRKAMFLAKKAISIDGEFAEARAFLEALTSS